VNLKNLNALPDAKVHFIEPMYAWLVNELPEGKEWLYEVKLDGSCSGRQRLARSKYLVTAGKRLHSPIPTHRKSLRKT
jgi:hypothetical protein